MELIDTHTHMYLKQFNDDIEEAVARAKENQVIKMVLPNIDASSFEQMEALTKKFPDYVHSMSGLHPCSVKEDYKIQLAKVAEELKIQGKYVAVGEIGMDLYWEKKFIKEQEESFRFQISLAKKHKLPIVIHCREAFDETLAILRDENDDDLKGIFHCFTGNLSQAEEILGYGGFKLGIGGVVTYKNSGLDKTLESLNLEDLVLETDSPYLSPVPFRGKRNETSYIKHVAQKIADIYHTNIEQVAKVTTANAKEMFKI